MKTNKGGFDVYLIESQPLEENSMYLPCPHILTLILNLLPKDNVFGTDDFLLLRVLLKLWLF